MQEQTVEDTQTFDAKRAFLSKKNTFPPLYVKSMQPLRQAVQAGMVQKNTPLLVMPIQDGAIALDIVKMSQHHVAQGEMAGEPWLVTF